MQQIGHSSAIMLGVPINVWGHAILPYLRIRDFQALLCTNKHNRADIWPALIAYKQWLLLEITTVKNNSNCQSLLEQIRTISTQAELELQPIGLRDMSEVRCISSHLVSCYQLSGRCTALYRSEAGLLAFFQSSLFYRLEHFDPMSFLIVDHLHATEALLISRGAAGGNVATLEVLL